MTALQPSEIHVWFLSLAAPAAEADWGWLDAAERARADRYRDDSAREVFVRTRQYLRYLLGRYLGEHPRDIGFTVNPYGKPGLSGAMEETGLAFNLSHTGALAVLGFARNTALGLDVESLKSRRNLEGLAKFCLAPAEFEWWRQTPPERQLSEFTRYWTSKEAFVKAAGRGIAMGLKNVVIRPDFNGFASIPGEYGSAQGWRLHEWAQPGYHVAMAYSGPKRRISVHGCGDEKPLGI
jgi:4'-phosphopantetheinyl transferase